MTFEVTILGCGAATPTSRHHPSAQLVNMHEKLFLVDCGEGTQMQLRKYKFRIQRIGHIFISHLHGDHYLGLMGLISSLHLLGRKTPLHVYGPAALKELLDLSWKVSDTWLLFPLEFHMVTDELEQLIYEDRTVEVHSIPLKHRISCCGYKFVEKQRPLKIRKEAVEEYRLKPSEILELKKGRIVVRPEGATIDPAVACVWPEPPRSYAYCSDTAYNDQTVKSVQGTSLLYHESTFLESEAKRAADTFHSTASQAAEVALRAGCKQLLLGHFSSRYQDDQAFLTEAEQVFPNSILSYEGLTVPVL
jgi:ribonuclease Z